MARMIVPFASMASAMPSRWLGGFGTRYCTHLWHGSDSSHKVPWYGTNQGLWDGIGGYWTQTARNKDMCMSSFPKIPAGTKSQSDQSISWYPSISAKVLGSSVLDCRFMTFDSLRIQALLWSQMWGGWKPPIHTSYSSQVPPRILRHAGVFLVSCSCFCG